MKDLIKQYLDQGMSRRQLVSGLSALGMSTVAAKAMAQNLAPCGPERRAGGGARARRDPRGRGQWRQAVRRTAQGGRRRIHLLQSLDRRSSDLRRAGRRAGDQADQGHSGRRRGRHGRRLCARLGQHRRRRRRQYRPAQRHDPDGQHLEGPDSAAGRGRLGRSGRARPRPVAGDRPPRADDRADHQMVLAGAVDGGDRRDDAARLEIRLDAAVRAGVSVAADQHARRPCQGAGLGAQQVRRADAHPSRQGRRREGGAHADRGAEPADQRRRRDHLVPRREGTGRARRAARRCRSPARPAIARLLVEAVPDPASAVSSARCCAPCAFPASPTCCSISATASASWRRPAPS